MSVQHKFSLVPPRRLQSIGTCCAGHWKLGHTPKNFLLGQVVILSQMSLFTFFRAAPGLFESFGFLKQQPVFMSIVLFQLLQGPLDEVSNCPLLRLSVQRLRCQDVFMQGSCQTPAFPLAQVKGSGVEGAP